MYKELLCVNIEYVSYLYCGFLALCLSHYSYIQNPIGSTLAKIFLSIEFLWMKKSLPHSCDRGKFMPMKFLNVHADVHTCAGKDKISPHEQVLHSWWQEKLAGIFSHSSVWLYLHLYSMFYGYNCILDE